MDNETGMLAVLSTFPAALRIAICIVGEILLLVPVGVLLLDGWLIKTNCAWGAVLLPLLHEYSANVIIIIPIMFVIFLLIVLMVAF